MERAAEGVSRKTDDKKGMILSVEQSPASTLLVTSHTHSQHTIDFDWHQVDVAVMVDPTTAGSSTGGDYCHLMESVYTQIVFAWLLSHTCESKVPNILEPARNRKMQKICQRR
jgi:hypothetical protein